MNETAAACANCDTTLLNGQIFCSQCGQKTSTHRLTLGGIGHDLVHALFHVDQSIFALLKGLLVVLVLAGHSNVRFGGRVNIGLVVSRTVTTNEPLRVLPA